MVHLLKKKRLKLKKFDVSRNIIYDVALSFAGEQRNFVEQVFNILKRRESALAKRTSASKFSNRANKHAIMRLDRFIFRLYKPQSFSSFIHFLSL
jgi:hypothetical protein